MWFHKVCYDWSTEVDTIYLLNIDDSFSKIRRQLLVGIQNHNWDKILGNEVLDLIQKGFLGYVGHVWVPLPRK